METTLVSLRHPETASLTMRIDQYVNLLTLSKTRCLSTETTLVSLRHPKTESTMTRIDQYGHLLPLSKIGCLSTKSTLVSPFRHPETIKSDYTHRPTWSSTPFVEDSMSIDRAYFSLPSSSRDGESDDRQRTILSSAPFVEDSMFIDQYYFSLSFSSSRDN